MGKRYGRNQKRQAREQIASLTAQLAAARTLADHATARAMAAERAIHSAEARAFDRFAQASGLLKAATEEMARAMGARLGDEVRPHAERLLTAAQSRCQEPFSVRLAREAVEDVVTIRGEIPALHYAYRLTGVALDEAAMIGRAGDG